MRHACSSTLSALALLAASASTSEAEQSPQPASSSSNEELFDSDFIAGFAEALQEPWDESSYYASYDPQTVVPYAEAYALSYDELTDVSIEELYRQWEYHEDPQNAQSYESYVDSWSYAEFSDAMEKGMEEMEDSWSYADFEGPSMRDSYDAVSLKDDLQALDLCDRAAAACSAECVAAGGGMLSLQCIKEDGVEGITAQCSCAAQAVVVEVNDFAALAALLDAIMPPQTILGSEQSYDTALQPRPCGGHKGFVEERLTLARLDSLASQRGFDRPAAPLAVARPLLGSAQVQGDLPPWRQNWPTKSGWVDPPLSPEQEWGVCVVRMALIVLMSIGIVGSFACFACKRRPSRVGVTVNPLCARLLDPESGYDDAESSGDSPAFDTPTEVVCLNPVFRGQDVEVESNRV